MKQTPGCLVRRSGAQGQLRPCAPGRPLWHYYGVAQLWVPASFLAALGAAKKHAALQGSYPWHLTLGRR